MRRMRAGFVGALVLAGLMAVAPVATVTGRAREGQRQRRRRALDRRSHEGRHPARPAGRRPRPRLPGAGRRHAEAPRARRPRSSTPSHADVEADADRQARRRRRRHHRSRRSRTANPAAGATIGASHTFSATVTDPSGVRSVTFTIVYPNGSDPVVHDEPQRQHLQHHDLRLHHRQLELAGRRDGQRRQGATSPPRRHTVHRQHRRRRRWRRHRRQLAVDRWRHGAERGRAHLLRDAHQQPAHELDRLRVLRHRRPGRHAGRSVIITAAHCVYDDVHKAFARNVLFIPNQDGTTGTGTDTNCANDPMGCWTPSFGVVDADWTTRTFPANIPWDYAYYVVPDAGAHSGTRRPERRPRRRGRRPARAVHRAHRRRHRPRARLLVRRRPELHVLREPLGTEPSYDDWWLGQCGLSGGSSGGPWLQPVNGGNGPIISVNSWGYTNQPGMAGPRLSGRPAPAACSARPRPRPFGLVTDPNSNARRRRAAC